MTTQHAVTTDELYARVEGLLAPTVGGSVPEHRIEEAAPLARIALARSIDGLSAAIDRLAVALSSLERN